MGQGGAYQARLSTFQTPAASSFYNSERRLFKIAKDSHSKIITLLTSVELPGPGEYQAPSEFGIYESKFKSKRA